MEIRPLTNSDSKSSRCLNLEDLLSFYVDELILDDKNAIKLGAFEENRLIGFAIGYKYWEIDTRAFELSVLAVRKEYQGIGVGKNLLITFESKVIENGGNRLVVGTMWRYSVRKFYRKLGYKLIETDKEYRSSTYEKRLI